MSMPNVLPTERCETGPGQRRRAVRALASGARDANDLRTLLDMLGLVAREGKDEPAEPAQQPAAGPAHQADADIGRELALAMLAAMRERSERR